ncbi:MAG: ion transporter [Candidatus Moraniibacteriota bacterium]
MSVQKFCKSAFSDVESQFFVPVNDFFAVLTIISILGIVLETVNKFSKYEDVFILIEFITVFFFSLEYIGRIIAAEKPWKYMVSFFGLIDLISIVPTFLGIANLTFLKSARLLRMMRFLRMIRLTKLLRMQKQHVDIENHGHDSLFRLTMQIYILALVSVILISATLMWFFEAESHEAFVNIPIAMVWSSKVLLGGVPQVMPNTITGEIITIITRFMGLVLFGLLISIVGGTTKRLLIGSDEVLNGKTTEK